MQRYDESWGEWLDITTQAELQDKAKIKVVVLPSKTSSKEDACEKMPPEEPKKGAGTFFMFVFIPVYEQKSGSNGHISHRTFFVYLYFSGMFSI